MGGYEYLPTILVSLCIFMQLPHAKPQVLLGGAFAGKYYSSTIDLGVPKRLPQIYKTHVAFTVMSKTCQRFTVTLKIPLL